MATKKQEERIEIVFIDVDETEYWRLCFFCIPCILPELKYVRIKNKMAKDGWTYEQTSPGYINGTVTLKFWRKVYATNS